MQLAVIVGMRLGEIFGLAWTHIGPDYADIRLRVYKGKIDNPKTKRSIRKAPLSEVLVIGLKEWRSMSLDVSPDGWVFPTERFNLQSRAQVKVLCSM